MTQEPYTTRILRVDANAPEADAIAQAAEILRGGELVAFPTETVYGLGANALDAEAVERIFIAKGRPSRNPLIVHAASVEAARALAADWPDTAQALAERFWPGPLTLVLPRRAVIPDIVTGGGTTVGIRVPSHPIALALLQAAGVPVAAPSANRSLRLSPTTAEHVRRDLDGRLPLILDGGATTGGLESTVLNLSVHPPRLLRPGLIPPFVLEAIIGPIARTSEVDGDTSGPLPSPGMLSRHYAPRAPLELTEDGSKRARELLAQGERVGWLTFAPQSAPGVTTVALPSDPVACAALLYAALHALDDAGVTRIVVDNPPEGEAWLAVRDRLTRAAKTE